MADPEAAPEAEGVSLPAPAELRGLSEPELQRLVELVAQAERQLEEEMAPIQARLQSLEESAAGLRTEVRRRERDRHLRSRQEVRTQVKEGEAPSLVAVLELEEPPFGEPALSELEFLLETGGLVALGYPGSRTASLQMTDGERVEQVLSLGEARRLYREGWELGVPARKGVRVHTPGTRLERLLDQDKVFVRLRGGGEPGTS